MEMYTSISLFWETLMLSLCWSETTCLPEGLRLSPLGQLPKCCGTMPLPETHFKLGIPLTRLALVGPTWDT